MIPFESEHSCQCPPFPIADSGRVRRLVARFLISSLVTSLHHPEDGRNHDSDDVGDSLQSTLAVDSDPLHTLSQRRTSRQAPPVEVPASWVVTMTTAWVVDGVLEVLLLPPVLDGDLTTAAESLATVDGDDEEEVVAAGPDPAAVLAGTAPGAFLAQREE